MELCELAEGRGGCLAYRLTEHVSADSITALARSIPEGTSLILWIDYLETQVNFDDILRRVAGHNVSDGANVRIIANCRTSYYRAELVDIFRTVVDIGNDSDDLTKEYRATVFFHILAQAGFNGGTEFAVKCSFNPVYAALAIYVSEDGRVQSGLSEELKKLVEDGEYRADLSYWLTKRLYRTFSALGSVSSISELVRAIVPLLGAFPILDQTFRRLNRNPEFNKYLTALIHDRLIELREPGDQPLRHELSRWILAHDIIADHFLIRYLNSSAIKDASVEELMFSAEEHGTLWSMLLSFQRIVVTALIALAHEHSIFIGDVFDCVTSWLEKGGPKKGVTVTFEAIFSLIDRGELEQKRTIQRWALDWLRKNPENLATSALAKLLIRFASGDPEMVESVMDWARLNLKAEQVEEIWSSRQAVSGTTGHDESCDAKDAE